MTPIMTCAKCDESEEMTWFYSPAIVDHEYDVMI
jgi:hypothetical protein